MFPTVSSSPAGESYQINVSYHVENNETKTESSITLILQKNPHKNGDKNSELLVKLRSFS